MFDMRRLFGRLFLLVLLFAAAASAQTGPALTTISDTVYRADGTPAGGTLLISWQSFTSADGHAVAGGTKNVTLGIGGALSVQLVPNTGAIPANTVYTVVFQLDDGAIKTEFWSVTQTTPTTIAAILMTPGSGGSPTQFATQQYVNAAVAPKANDSAVVHLGGSEVISGTKQFAVAPTLPTPVHAGDATNKTYVDTAVSNVGSGNYVSKAGDTMTGPLTLAGDPVASNQASNKHYVDSGLAGTAGLVAGVVPTGELGMGTANTSVCLHGDSTWGACGTSSNASSIQSVPVATTPPTDSQVITYVASLGQYVPKAGGGVSGGMQAIKYATDFAFSQSPSANLGVAGAQTVTLSACALGVTGSEPQYYVYVSGTGTAEAVLVTGGTCAGNGQAGTLQFTTANAHSAGYTVTSASGGLQEALIAARFAPTNPPGSPQGGRVVVPPGELNAYARVSIRSSNITVDFSGSIVNCWMNATCIFVGDPVSSNNFNDITLVNPRGRPTIANGASPFIQVNAQKTRIFNVATRLAFSGGTFSSYVQVDDDQAFLLDGLDTTLGQGGGSSGVRCDATVCNPIVYAPGPFNVFSAVGWLKHLNISMQCSGNGVDWQSGNTLRISDSIIQGVSQYGVRGGTKRGGFGGVQLENLYEEIGGCSNPAGAIGQAGVIAQGSRVMINGGEAPGGSAPTFVNTGTTDYRYYIVAHNGTYGTSNPLYAGRALTNGTGNIPVTTADIVGASTFDLLRVPGPTTSLEQAPYGVGNYAVATGVTRASACANGVCTFSDTQAALASYTVPPTTYFPLLDYWPGSLILGGNQDSSNVLNVARAWTQAVPSGVVALQGALEPAVISTTCDSLGSWTPMWISCYSGMAPSTFYEQGAFLMAVKPNADGGLKTNLKGRLNFPTLGSGPGHIITLSDSNFQKTMATANNRPINDASDAFIGYDFGNGDPTQIGISFGAPKSLSNYIGNVGDGTNWLERLTPSLKEFKTNVQMDSALTVAGTVQASSFISTGTGAWSVAGNFGTLSPAASGKSLIGFGASGKVQVSENGGAVVEVAKLDTSGNLSENANTATQLAQTPTQCSGSFATGVQANGNANCGTASVLQLSETTQPAGIANYGLFWFDSTCHCPKVLDNNGQPVQLGLLNVFNQDSGGTNPANTLEEVNGPNPQALRIYGTWTNATNWERTGLGWDQTDGYFVVRNENVGTGSQRGLGFWLGTHIVWAIDTLAAFKPFTDNSYNIGNTTFRPKTIYAATSFDLSTSGAQTLEICNDSTTGTSLNFLAKLNSATPSCAIKAGTSDTSGIVGIVAGGSGTSGNAIVAYKGYANCSFDGATTAGDFIQISSTNAADCHDAGGSYPASGQVLGRVLSTNASAGTYGVLVGAEGQAGGAVGSVFGRSGAVVAASGDYAVAQITGAAPIASPNFTGSPTAPTASSSDSSTKIATTAYVQAQTCPIWFSTSNAASTVNFTTTANKAVLWGVVLSCNLLTSQVTYDVATIDNTSNTYDIGLVNSAGTVVAHIGSTAGTSFAGSVGWKTLSWTASAQLPPGKYYLALTTNCTTSCAVLEGGNSGTAVTFAGNISESVTAGGTLPSTITVPSDVYTATTVPTFSVH